MSLAVAVASPALLRPSCRTPRQMELAAGLCRASRFDTMHVALQIAIGVGGGLLRAWAALAIILVVARPETMRTQPRTDTRRRRIARALFLEQPEECGRHSGPRLPYSN